LVFPLFSSIFLNYRALNTGHCPRIEIFLSDTAFGALPLKRPFPGDPLRTPTFFSFCRANLSLAVTNTSIELENAVLRILLLWMSNRFSRPPSSHPTLSPFPLPGSSLFVNRIKIGTFLGSPPSFLSRGTYPSPGFFFFDFPSSKYCFQNISRFSSFFSYLRNMPDIASRAHGGTALLAFVPFP